MDPNTTGSETGIFYLAVAGIFAFLFVAVGMAVLYLFSQRRDRDKQKKLYEQKLEFQQRLLTASLQGQEAERERLAKELHDGINGTLAAIKLQLAGATEPAARSRVGEAISGVSQEIRAISHDLMPPAFAQRGLVAATQGLCDRITDGGELTVFLQCNDPRRRFDTQRELNVFRMIQELLGNCLKHAEAQRIDLALQFSPDRLLLKYEDDGKGFDYTPAPGDGEALASLGLGMSNLQARTDLLGGTLQIESAPGNGFRARLEIVIANPESESDADR